MARVNSPSFSRTPDPPAGRTAPPRTHRTRPAPPLRPRQTRPRALSRMKCRDPGTARGARTFTVRRHPRHEEDAAPRRTPAAVGSAAEERKPSTRRRAGRGDGHQRNDVGGGRGGRETQGGSRRERGAGEPPPTAGPWSRLAEGQRPGARSRGTEARGTGCGTRGGVSGAWRHRRGGPGQTRASGGGGPVPVPVTRHRGRPRPVPTRHQAASIPPVWTGVLARCGTLTQEPLYDPPVGTRCRGGHGNGREGKGFRRACGSQVRFGRITRPAMGQSCEGRHSSAGADRGNQPIDRRVDTISKQYQDGSEGGGARWES